MYPQRHRWVNNSANCCRWCNRLPQARQEVALDEATTFGVYGDGGYGGDGVAVMGAPAFAGGNANMGGGNGHVNNQNGGHYSPQTTTYNQSCSTVTGGANSPVTDACKNTVNPA